MTAQTSSARGRRGEVRWAFLEGLDVGADGDPYLDRLRIVQTPLFGIYLHHIHRADRERDPHDHPWWFASLILTGSYEEDVWPDKHKADYWRTRQRRRFSVRCTRRGQAHIITRTVGPLWTLVLVGRRESGWGFYPGGRFVPWRAYIEAEPS